LFRAKVEVGNEKKWLITSFEWRFLIEVKSKDLHVLGLPARADSVRSTLLALGAGVPTSLIVVETFWYLNSYLSMVLSGWAIPVWALVSLVFAFGIWISGMVGMLYLLDFLTIGLQARHAVDLATLSLKEVHLGKFRHTLRVSVEKEINLPGYKGGRDFLLIVAATRRGLMSAIGPLLPTTTSPVS